MHKMESWVTVQTHKNLQLFQRKWRSLKACMSSVLLVDLHIPWWWLIEQMLRTVLNSLTFMMVKRPVLKEPRSMSLLVQSRKPLRNKLQRTQGRGGRNRRSPQSPKRKIKKKRVMMRITM
uniref:Uncharacterized protein n=1 Tax=Opuntia streptacantha TaxID=393608 RepID=A0A7C8YUE7_OPUST